jgi:S-adenosylmethionine hydrolase
MAAAGTTSRAPKRRRRATKPAFEARAPGAARIVTLSSDFGTADGYVGAMKGVILGGSASARIVDITHEIGPGDVRGGALALEAAAPFFPAGTVHLVVVDPGVGTRRRAIAVEAADATFVGPDNGVLSLAAKGPRRVFVLDRAERHRATVSATFHGRDVFAPIVALLAEGARLRDLGTPTAGMTDLELPVPSVSPREVVGQVIHEDRFGNLVTNLTTNELRTLLADFGAGGCAVSIGRRSAGRIVRAYGDGERGALLALVGSSGRLEIAVREGSAARRLRHRADAETVVRVVGVRTPGVLRRL